MIKSKITELLRGSNSHLSKRDIETVVNTIFEKVAAALASGQRVELRGFGVFVTRVRPARIGRNPRNGVAVEVGPKRVIGFKLGKALLDRLNFV